MEHKTGRKIIRCINRFITFIESLVLLLLLVFGGYSIWDNHQIDTEGSASKYEMYKPTAKDTRNFDDFVKINPEVCGWLTLNGTGINYALVHGPDNDKYMNTTPDLKFALSGSLFLDCQNKPDFSDFNTIIYGHHMAEHAMFGDLDLYAKKKFFDHNKSGTIYFDGNTHKLDVFAFLVVNAYDSNIYHICQNGDRADYLSYIQNHASNYRDIGVTDADHILILSTCMNDRTNGRYILAARIGNVIMDTEENNNTEKGSQTHFPIWIIGPLLIVLLIIICLLVYRKKKAGKNALQSDEKKEKTAKEENKT